MVDMISMDDNVAFGKIAFSSLFPYNWILQLKKPYLDQMVLMRQIS